MKMKSVVIFLFFIALVGCQKKHHAVSEGQTFQDITGTYSSLGSTGLTEPIQLDLTIENQNASFIEGYITVDNSTTPVRLMGNFISPFGVAISLDPIAGCPSNSTGVIYIRSNDQLAIDLDKPTACQVSWLNASGALVRL